MPLRRYALRPAMRSTRLRSMTPRSLTDREGPRRKLAEIRATGVAISIGEAVYRPEEEP